MVYTKESACEQNNTVKPRQKFNGGISRLNEKNLSDDFKSSDKYSADYQQKLSRSIGTLLSSYTRAINKQENRKGSLFRAKTKAKSGIIDGFITIEGKHKDLFFKTDKDYAATCSHYIHQNPVKANLCKQAENWRYSSAIDYAGLRNGTLCNKELAQRLFFDNW